MTPLRDEIADIVYDSNFEVGMHSRKTADAIIALLRDRLTSDAALTAACEAWQASDAPYFEGNMSDAITAALDVVSGKIRA